MSTVEGKEDCAVCGGVIIEDVCYAPVADTFVPLCEADFILGRSEVTQHLTDEEIKVLTTMRANPWFSGNAEEALVAYLKTKRG